MTRILICLFALALAGCGLMTKRVPVVTEAPKCVVPSGLLAGCSKPSAIFPGITFDDLADALRRDRNSLEECTARFEDLANAVLGCNSLLDTHNAAVRAINDAAKK
jgi:hypothetical protein